MAKEDILQQIEEMSVKDLAELVEMIEERFNVSAAMAAPVAVAVAPGAGGAESDAAPDTLGRGDEHQGEAGGGGS
jgi:large subunit ribosomal protein L7/L12